MGFSPELLVPAGDMEKFQAAVQYGADAVYLGGGSGNLRASSKGFSQAELVAAMGQARARGVKIYYCVNSLPFERDMDAVPAMVGAAAEAGVDAFIIADPGVLRVALREAPHIPVHISTQANTTNAEAVRFWLDMGASRVNLARELSHREIKAVRQKLPQAELEVFVHGAMCLAVSGQCLLSAWLNERPANQGRCTQPCRFEYRAAEVSFPPLLTLEESVRQGETLWDVTREEGYAAVFAPDDLCLLPFLPWFVKNEITSLKIEGRMKGASYVAHVADSYRAGLDAARASVASGTAFRWREYMSDLLRTASRPLSTGFFLVRRKKAAAFFNGGLEERPLLARVIEPLDTGKGAWSVAVRGKWNAAKPAELMLPGMRRPVLPPGGYALENHRGEAALEVNSGTRAVLYTESRDLAPGIFIRGA